MAAGHGNSGRSMDITEHQKTWAGFVGLVKWSMAAIFVLMFLLFLFRTHG